jgi:hypothetical protein
MKKGSSVMWQYLIPLILALIVFLAMFAPGVTWVKDSWKKFTGTIGNLWKRDNPKIVDPGSSTKMDALNKALRDPTKITQQVFNHGEFQRILNNMEYLQDLPMAGGIKAYLLKSTPDGQRPLYMVYRTDGERPVSRLVYTVDADNVYSYSLPETFGTPSMSDATRLQLAQALVVKYQCEVDWWFDKDIDMLLAQSQVYCPKSNYYPSKDMDDRINAVIRLGVKQ